MKSFSARQGSASRSPSDGITALTMMINFGASARQALTIGPTEFLSTAFRMRIIDDSRVDAAIASRSHTIGSLYRCFAGNPYPPTGVVTKLCSNFAMSGRPRPIASRTAGSFSDAS
jgi:hypothetical protein